MTSEHLHKPNRDKPWTTTGFVLSLVGLVLFFFPYLGIICAAAGIVISAKQMRKNKSGLATAGLVIGIIAFLIDLAILIVAILILTGAIQVPIPATY